LDKLDNTPYIPVSWGELFDKICILEIKKDKAPSGRPKENISKELELLLSFISNDLLNDLLLTDLRTALKEVNKEIWLIEDEIRAKESVKDFRQGFIKLARNTYILNDKRAAIKRKINIFLNSTILEEKIY
tara:strand:- start:72 stop:464 length:393 start_codon:yes stop_codon:yes gene_type:complete